MSVTRGDILLTVCQQHLLSQVDMTWKEGRWKRVMERGREGGRGGQKDNKQTWSISVADMCVTQQQVGKLTKTPPRLLNVQI